MSERAVPHRVQLRRTKGWKMPANTVKVDRTTRWGNPFVMERGGLLSRQESIAAYTQALACGFVMARMTGRGTITTSIDDVRRELRGKNLACWCKPGEPCHADVLLEIANAPPALAKGEG